MSSIRILGLFTLAASLACGQVFIDFENITAGDQPSDFLAAYGIASITSSGGGTAIRVYDYGSEPIIVVPSGTKAFLPSGGLYPSPAGYFTTTLTFATPVTYFSFTKIAEQTIPGHPSLTYGIAGWRAQAFDESGGLVDTAGIGLSGGLDFPSPTPNVEFTLAGSSYISSVVFTVNYNYMSSAGSVGIDNFQFAPVPEPTSGAVLAGVAALAGAWLIRRRRSKAA